MFFAVQNAQVIMSEEREMRQSVVSAQQVGNALWGMATTAECNYHCVALFRL
jgi:hypothetical protein